MSGFGAPQSKIFSAICGHYREKAAFGNESVSVLGQREIGEGGTPFVWEGVRTLKKEIKASNMDERFVISHITFLF